MTPTPRTAAARWMIASMLAATAAFAAPATVGTPPAVGEQAADFELKNLAGEATKLSALTDAGPVALVLLRGWPGYQCPMCTKQVGEWLGNAGDFKAAGAKVVFVYPGPADGLKSHADEFVAGRDYPDNFVFLLDPDYAFTNQYGLRWDAKNETSHASTFVLDKSRTVKFAKTAKGHGDRAKAADVLKVITGLPK